MRRVCCDEPRPTVTSNNRKKKLTVRSFRIPGPCPKLCWSFFRFMLCSLQLARTVDSWPTTTFLCCFIVLILQFSCLMLEDVCIPWSFLNPLSKKVNVVCEITSERWRFHVRRISFEVFHVPDMPVTLPLVFSF